MKACVWSAQGEAGRHAVRCVSVGHPLPLASYFSLSFLSLLSPSISRTQLGGGCSWKHPELQQNTSAPSPGLHIG